MALYARIHYLYINKGNLSTNRSNQIKIKSNRTLSQIIKPTQQDKKRNSKDIRDYLMLTDWLIDWWVSYGSSTDQSEMSPTVACGHEINVLIPKLRTLIESLEKQYLNKTNIAAKTPTIKSAKHGKSYEPPPLQPSPAPSRKE